MYKIINILNKFEEDLANSKNTVIGCFEKIIKNYDYNKDDFNSKDNFITICIACLNCIISNEKLYKVTPYLKDYNDEFLNSTNQDLVEDTEKFLKDYYKNTVIKVKTILQSVSKNTLLSTEYINYINLLIEGIIWNDENKFLSAFKINSKYSMANLYLFMHYFNEMSFEEYENKEKYTNEMTKYYVNLTPKLQSHLLNNTEKFKYIPFLSFDLEERVESGILDRLKESFEVVTNPLHGKRLIYDNFKEKMKEIEINDSNYKSEENRKWIRAFGCLDFYFNQFVQYKNNRNTALFSEDTTEKEIFNMLFEEVFELDTNNLWDSVGDININHKEFMKYLRKFFTKYYPSIFSNNIIKNDLINKILQIPTLSSISKSDLVNALALSEKTMQLADINEKLEKEKHKKSDLINQNVHSWTHIVYPNIVLDVATTLYEENQIEKAVKLFEAHNSQTLLINTLNLLKIEYNSTDQDFRYDLQDSFCSSKHEKAVNILSILDYSLNTVLSKLVLEEFYSNDGNVFDKTHRPILQKSFIDKIIKKDISTVEWFSKDIYEINIINQWEDINAMQDDLGFILLVDIFINLLNNIINYGVKTKKGYINIDFYIEENYHFIKFINPIDRNSMFLQSKNQGLNSIKYKLAKFNNNDDNNNITVDDNGEIFEISIKFDSEILGG